MIIQWYTVALNLSLTEIKGYQIRTEFQIVSEFEWGHFILWRERKRKQTTPQNLCLQYQGLLKNEQRDK
jgi:hypothetical protein